MDVPAYFRLLEDPSPTEIGDILDRLSVDRLVRREVNGRWSVTNVGAMLLAYDLRQFDESLARKGVRVTQYEGKDKASRVLKREIGRQGYASGFEALIQYISALLPSNEHISEALRVEHRLYPEIAIRELTANALLHQDMTIHGAGPNIEIFDGRIEFNNPGESLLPPERMIDLPPRSRNECMAGLARRMRICEEQGSGLDKVVSAAGVWQLPAPFFSNGADNFIAILYAPRSFAEMTVEERMRACYQHAVLSWLRGERMRNESLRERLNIEKHNASQATHVLNQALSAGLITYADPDHPRAGYVPAWANQSGALR